MHIQHVLTPDVVRDLPDGFEKRQTFNVTHCSADFDDRDIDSFRDPHDRLLDLICHMRHDLNCAAEVIAASFFRDDRVIDATGRVIALLGQ